MPVIEKNLESVFSMDEVPEINLATLSNNPYLECIRENEELTNFLIDDVLLGLINLFGVADKVARLCSDVVVLFAMTTISL